MRVAILTFEGFNEVDVFLAFNLLNRLDVQGWRAEIASPGKRVTSVHGATVEAHRPLTFANDADAVIFAGTATARAMTDLSYARGLLDRLELDPLRQHIAGQSSGTLLMAKLGLLGDLPACTDPPSRRWLLEAGVRVHEGPFHARGPVATAGGCLAAPYVATWLMAVGAGVEAARKTLRQAAPVGEDESYADRVLDVVRPFIASS